MRDGERQVAPLFKDIRRDHTARYQWATRVLGDGARVLDLACGVGYGSWLLAATGHEVLGLDRDPEAIAYARTHYPHRRARFEVADASALGTLPELDAAVCFETIEHVADPRPMLRALHAAAPLLLASVPNEDVIPYGRGFAFHHRHYTQAQFGGLLASCGWQVREWLGQEGPESDVAEGMQGRTLIAIADKVEMPKDTTTESLPAWDDGFPVPEHVTILGLGPSLERYVDIAKRLGGKHAYCDEVWGINAVGGVLMCDRIFHMDDVRVQETRAKAAPESNIARMLEWVRVHPGPVITSRAHPDYPGLVEFPLGAVLNEFRHAYFNSTAAYAVAYAVHLGVKKISLFGIDYTYPNAHQAEKGRACVEFWLGMATARGIKVMIPKESTLMDALHTEADRLYGYDGVEVKIQDVGGGKLEVRMIERSALPSAAEIEARYDHARHPNAMVDQAETKDEVAV